MNFAELYRIIDATVASGGTSPKPVTFEFLRTQVTQDKTLVENLDVLRVTYRPPIQEARFTLFDEREGLHEEPQYFAEISFCASLEVDPSFLLFALTKELMHVFDPMDTWINTREKFISFLRDLQNTPLDMANGSISVEHKAKWMAILALCPKTLQNYIKDSLQNHRKLKNELAQELGLPNSLIEIVIDDYYDVALQIMLANP